MADKKDEKPHGTIPEKWEIQQQPDFQRFVEQCDSTEGWNSIMNKDHLKIWDQKVPGFSLNKVRGWAIVENVPPEVLYDTLHDPEYRSVWDENMVQGYKIEQVDPYNDVGYYSAKSPAWGISGRDFCNQRSWYVNRPTNTEYMIINHSVRHEKCPEDKHFVRANSISSGYLVRTHEKGCTLTYVSLSDPKGMLPSWVVNLVMTKVAPQLLEKLIKAARGYVEWKNEHDPNRKPWLSNEPYDWEKPKPAEQP